MKISLAAVWLAACAFAAAADLQAQPAPAGTLYEFGDSLQDANYYCRSWGSPLGACSNNRNIPMQLGTLSAYAFVSGNDFAIGNTASGPGTIAVGLPPAYPAYPGYPPGTYPNMFGQIAEFQALGRAIGPNDLVSVSYAGNDVRYGIVPGQGAVLARTVVGYLTQDIQGLISLGGRNFILMGGLPSDRIIVGGISMANHLGVADSDDRDYYTALNSAMPGAVAPFESASVHLRVLDVNSLVNRVLNTPQLYGFLPGDCFDIPGCLAAPTSVQNQYAFIGGHPTDSFSLVIAEYIQNLLNSAYQVPAQADLAEASMRSFGAALLARLAAEHAQPAAPETGRERKLSIFASGGYAGGATDDQANTSGMNWDQGDSLAGAEYRIDPSLRLGVAFGYARPTAALKDDLGTISFDSYQLAGFASLSRACWYADAVVSGALNGYQLSRPGVIDTLTASPNGASLGVGAQGAYLFEAGPLRLGPVAGLNFAHVSVDPYVESGDIILAQAVDRQTLDTLSGRAGAELRAPVMDLRGRKLASFLDLTAERSLLAGSRIITTSGADPNSAVPVYTPVDRTTQTYGRVTAGLEVGLWRQISLLVSGEQTFACSSGNYGGVSGTLSIDF